MSEQNRTAPRWQDVPEEARESVRMWLGSMRRAQADVRDDARFTSHARQTADDDVRAIDAALACLERVGAALRGEPVPEDASAAGPSAPPGPCPTCEAVWAATGVASVVRGLAALDDVVQTTREHLIEARRERDSYARRIAALRTTLADALVVDTTAGCTAAREEARRG